MSWPLTHCSRGVMVFFPKVINTNKQTNHGNQVPFVKATYWKRTTQDTRSGIELDNQIRISSMENTRQRTQFLRKHHYRKSIYNNTYKIFVQLESLLYYLQISSLHSYCNNPKTFGFSLIEFFPWTLHPHEYEHLAFQGTFLKFFM